MTKRRMDIQVGDTVAYSQGFGRSVGADHGMMRARAVVIGLDKVGTMMLARLAWRHDANLPTRVNVKNLARPGTARFAG